MYERINEYLNTCVEKNILSHGYIFYGPDEINKKNIAAGFVKKILNTNSIHHPDLIVVASDNEEPSINVIRQLQKFLILSPYSSNYKVVIIEAFETLSAYSQATLLHIFEEAPSHAIIILYAKTIDSIPKTIASRGVKLPFWKQYESDPLNDTSMISFFNEILSGNPQNLYYKSQNFGDYKAIEVFRLWLGFLRKRFLSDPNKKLASLLKTSQNIYFKLNETNINPKFAYDELLLTL